MAPDDPSVHLHYGLFLMDSERNLEAAREFAKAAQLNPEDYESVFNAGVAYRQAGGRNSEAEMFYRKAVQLRPKVHLHFTYLHRVFRDLFTSHDIGFFLQYL
jgi:Flp pilus assembly protein TadD